MFSFSPEKTVQASSFLLGRAKGSMNYMKLIKLLYLADRTALVRFDAPITGDSYFSLKLGPILSQTFDLIKGKETSSYWSKHFVCPDDRNSKIIHRIKDPGVGDLSPAEVGVLEEIWQQHSHLSQFALAELTHRICPEWRDPGRGRVPIRIAEILKSAGRTPAQIRQIKQEQEEYEQVVSLLK